MYAGIGYNPYDTHGVPPLGDGPDPKFDCSTIDWSTISQEMANFIAAATAAGCTVPPWPPIPGVPPFPNPPEIDDGGITPSPPAPFNTNEDLQQFTNDAQTVTLTCPNGSTFSQTIEAGAIYSPLMDPAVGPSWVAYINAWIYSYLLSVALADQACMTIPNVTERCAPQPIPCDWPAGCPWPPTDASCWPPGWIWPDIPGCPNPPTDPACFPPDTDWTRRETTRTRRPRRARFYRTGRDGCAWAKRLIRPRRPTKSPAQATGYSPSPGAWNLQARASFRPGRAPQFSRGLPRRRATTSGMSRRLREPNPCSRLTR